MAWSLSKIVLKFIPCVSSKSKSDEKDRDALVPNTAASAASEPPSPPPVAIEQSQSTQSTVESKPSNQPLFKPRGVIGKPGPPEPRYEDDDDEEEGVQTLGATSTADTGRPNRPVVGPPPKPKPKPTPKPTPKPSFIPRGSSSQAGHQPQYEDSDEDEDTASASPVEPAHPSTSSAPAEPSQQGSTTEPADKPKSRLPSIPKVTFRPRGRAAPTSRAISLSDDEDEDEMLPGAAPSTGKNAPQGRPNKPVVGPSRPKPKPK
ncbi:uncharacterized protein STEHIDRAFT_147249 [Stereum hirsutum FP-91666 SS1]|uniref:uncharacterized protein n=1 Tax=Stereum hirsutum (strain FP-91666) TaxID=721885 RepID=UPI000444A2C2|nr:uncharacterized protein STEHIDRAFT_147249 [Stereum hirsutum FP-91666 SS1]EIM86760.1 hypothetical protein STEHIDRAFT_147249 [Stereum hirsutum FP-91666 SS1]